MKSLEMTAKTKDFGDATREGEWIRFGEICSSRSAYAPSDNGRVVSGLSTLPLDHNK